MQKGWHSQGLGKVHQASKTSHQCLIHSAKKVYFHQLAGKLQSPRDFLSQYHKFNPKHTRTPPSLNHNGSRASSPKQLLCILFHRTQTSALLQLPQSAQPNSLQCHLHPQRGFQTSVNVTLHPGPTVFPASCYVDCYVDHSSINNTFQRLAQLKHGP